VLEAYVRQVIQSQDTPEIHFAWQGGEPTLMGVDFFRRAVALQERFADGRPIHNAFQTNGVLLNREWGEFLAAHGFLVGLSVDGPAELHDAYRVDKGGKPTFERVMKGLGVLKECGVEFNTLTVVNARNCRHPLKVYRFLRDIGSTFHQYIPLVERLPGERAKAMGLSLAEPPTDDPDSHVVAPWSVPSIEWGKFLAAIFDEWVTHDVGRVFVNHFENTLAAICGVGPSMCVYRETCGEALVIEHNGDVYSCDHFVYPQYNLGNVVDGSLREMIDSPQQTAFGEAKATSLPGFCWRCPFVEACHGECPKHRFIETPDGEPGLNYLCSGLKHYFAHVWPTMRQIEMLLRQGKQAAAIMELPRSGRR
jgi:uncharacterized protein